MKTASTDTSSLGDGPERHVFDQLKKEMRELLEDEFKRALQSDEPPEQTESRDILVPGAEVCALGEKHRFRLYWVKGIQDKYYYVFHCDCGRRCAYSKPVLQYLLGGWI